MTPLMRLLRDPWSRICHEPVSATTLTVVAIAATVASTGVAIASAMAQADAASDAAKYNAQVARRNALLAQQQAAMDAEAQGRHARQQLGAARAAYGASGVAAEGSPLEVLSSSAQLAELDRETILYKGRLQAMGYRDETALDVARSETAQQQGTMGAGSALLGGAAKGVKYYGDMSGSTPAPSASAPGSVPSSFGGPGVY